MFLREILRLEDLSNLDSPCEERHDPIEVEVMEGLEIDGTHQSLEQVASWLECLGLLEQLAAMVLQWRPQLPCLIERNQSANGLLQLHLDFRHDQRRLYCRQKQIGQMHLHLNIEWLCLTLSCPLTQLHG